MATSAASDLTQILDDLMLVLSEKEREVVSRRFALSGSERETLESIGQHFGVTRERIRQIENVALTKLRRTITTSKLKKVRDVAKEKLILAGEICLEEKLIYEVLNSIHSVSKIDGNIIRLSLSADETLTFERCSDFRPFWHTEKITLADVRLISEKAVKTLEKVSEVLDEIKLTNLVRAALANRGKSFDASTIASIFAVDPRLKKAEEGWGLMSWRHINPRSLRDKSLIVMREQQKPMHFVEIANEISDRGFDRKVVTVQAVHNELIRDENFVLIGRGLYALREWGYSEGTVADIIEDLLKEKSPLTKDEIIRGVLKQRQVKKGTISLNLQKTEHFVRVDRGLYKLDLSKKPKIDATKRRRGGRKDV